MALNNNLKRKRTSFLGGGGGGGGGGDKRGTHPAGLYADNSLTIMTMTPNILWHLSVQSR